MSINIKKDSIEDKTLRSAIRFGFTYQNDTHFKDWNQGNRIINKLVKNGMLYEYSHEYGVDYRPTDQIIDYYKYN